MLLILAVIAVLSTHTVAVKCPEAQQRRCENHPSPVVLCDNAVFNHEIAKAFQDHCRRHGNYTWNLTYNVSLHCALDLDVLNGWWSGYHSHENDGWKGWSYMSWLTYHNFRNQPISAYVDKFADREGDLCSYPPSIGRPCGSNSFHNSTLDRSGARYPNATASNGMELGNLREHALSLMKELGLACRDVRTREEIHNKIRPCIVEVIRRDYAANGGPETFLSYEDLDQGRISVIRELHVYGSVVPVSGNPSKFQHQGFDQLLMEEAARIAFYEHNQRRLLLYVALELEDITGAIKALNYFLLYS
ncbi:unnamed protein product [Cylicocyclus nassatus]|uniref:Uncharacterized protein n=1 Tax=Cylicocyclus nassatus TaxID=53992 RepID=A0AA36DQH4_CYLNA|nr:unnamed protein product [Cylicocyclus nassatus]